MASKGKAILDLDRRLQHQGAIEAVPCFTKQISSVKVTVFRYLNIKV